MILKLELKLDPCPSRGGGLNTWMFKTAAHLARHGVSQAEAKQFISSQAGDSARPGEVDRQVEQGYAAATGEEPVRIESGEFIITKKPRTPQWPDRDDALIREAVETRRASIEDIIKASPLHPDTTRHPVDVLAELHNAQGDELLCMAPRPASGFCTLTFNKWAAGIRRRLATGKPSQSQNWEMVVPNLMKAPTGTTKEGRPYRPRTSENACDPDQMRFVVVEVDISHDDPICSTLGATPQEICASVILSKLDLAQVRMVVQSGGEESTRMGGHRGEERRRGAGFFPRTYAPRRRSSGETARAAVSPPKRLPSRQTSPPEPHFLEPTTMKKKETHTFQVEAKVPAIYYAGRNGYAIEYKGGFIPLTSESQVKQHLVASKVPDDQFNDLLCKIRLENFVSYIGPVAGHQPGIHISPESGQPFLVTTGPKIIGGVEGDWNFIGDFLRDLLGDEIQLQAALAWLRQARRNVLAGKRRPLPAAVFVGPRKCGKTLFIELARLCLGGRVASALAALSGSTQFNGHTLGSELLVIDDEIASKQHSTRTALAQGIKKQLFAGSVSIEAKHRDPIAMRPVQGIIIAVNDEPEHLQVLPAMDDSVADKISLFSCERARLGDLTEPDEIAAAIKAELPAFCFFLDTTDHPEELKDSRTGASAWQNPAVQESLQSIAPEERFRELLAQCTPITEAISSSGFWRGTSAEIERLLADNDVTRNSARSLLSWPSACGVFLGRLESGRRAALSKSCIHGINQWRITGLEPLGAEQTQLRW